VFHSTPAAGASTRFSASLKLFVF